MFVPRFIITNKILKNIGIIEAAKEVIQHAPLLPYYEKQFQKDALVRSVHFGTHIEGNELNLTQAEKVIMGQQVIARERDIQEVINYRKVMEYIAEFQISNFKYPISNETSVILGSVAASCSGQASITKGVTEEFILQLHKMTVDKILPIDAAGKFRKTQVVIKNSLTGEITFRPPIAVEVPFQINDLLQFINASTAEAIHPVLKSGIVHYEFVRIHPFTDGNGRVSRALSTKILFEEGYDIRKFFSLEEYFDCDASRYYAALQSVEQESGNLTTWLEYFTEGLAIELAKIKTKVESVSVDGKIKEKLGGKPLMLSERQMAIIEYIQKVGYLENKGFKSLFPMISEDSVLLDIKQLVGAGLIKKQGVTKGAKYVMTK